MKNKMKNILHICIVVIFVFAVVLLSKTALGSQVQAQSTTVDLESIVNQTYTGKVKSIPCEKNTGNETKLCYLLWQSGGYYITGGSDKINNKISQNVGNKVQVTGFWINVSDPWYFVVKSMTVLTQPTPTNIPPLKRN